MLRTFEAGNDKKSRTSHPLKNFTGPHKKKQVRSDNDASEVDILGHFGIFLGHFGTFWDIMGQFGRLYDEFGAFRPFS